MVVIVLGAEPLMPQSNSRGRWVLRCRLFVVWGCGVSDVF